MASLDSTVWVSAQVVTDFRFLASVWRFLTRERMSLSACSRASDTFFCCAMRVTGLRLELHELGDDALGVHPRGESSELNAGHALQSS